MNVGHERLRPSGTAKRTPDRPGGRWLRASRGTLVVVLLLSLPCCCAPVGHPELYTLARIFHEGRRSVVRAARRWSSWVFIRKMLSNVFRFRPFRSFPYDAGHTYVCAASSIVVRSLVAWVTVGKS